MSCLMPEFQSGVGGFMEFPVPRYAARLYECLWQVVVIYSGESR